MSTIRILLLAVLLACLVAPSASFADTDEASLMTQARNHFRESNYYFASTWLERVLKKFPDTPRLEEVLLMLAKSYAATSRDEKAVWTLKTLLKQFPNAAEKLEPALLKMVQDSAGQPPKLAEPRQPAAAPGPVAKSAPVEAAASPSVAAGEVASEKAAAEKAAAEKAAAEKAAAEKAAAEKAAVEKAAAEKAIADKVAADRVAAQRVEAEREAAEKEAAEKAAAQKGSAGKAMTVEEATAERAAAIKAAVEKAAAEKAAAQNTALAKSAEAPEEPARAAAASEPAAIPASETVSAADSVYTLDFGSYVLKSEMVQIKKKITSAGMKPLVEPGPKKKEQMSRIHVGEYADKKAAEKMLQKLRKAKADNFMLQDKAGNYNVYAGSYVNKVGAVNEQLRLAGFGITTELRQISVQVPTLELTAGAFKSEEAAAQKGTELERFGVKPAVVKRPVTK